MQASTPVRRIADAQETRARWERTGVRCVHTVRRMARQAEALTATMGAGTSLNSAIRRTVCTHRTPVFGAGTEQPFSAQASA